MFCRVASCRSGGWTVAEQSQDQGTQKRRQPAPQEGEVVADRRQDGIDAVALTTFQMIAAHAVLGFQMPDHRLDRRASLHLALEGCRGPAHLARDPDLETVRVIVPAIALVDMRALDRT